MSQQGSVWRTGQAAVATTAPGTAPSYGLSVDLGTGQWINADQFQQFVRDTTAYSQQSTITAAQEAALKTLHDQEIERANNFQNSNLFVLNTELPNLFGPDDAAANYSDSGGVGGFLHDVFVSPAENVLDTAGGALSAVGHATASGWDQIVGGGGDVGGEVPEDAYAQYFSKGGLLTESEFNQFDDRTKLALLGHATKSDAGSQIAGAPGVKQTLAGVDAAYHGLKVPFYMVHQSSEQNPNGVPLNLSNILNPMWFDPSNYAAAWRESNDTTVGNEILSSMLAPVTSQEQLDNMRKHSAVYQFTAVGAELAATWSIDPLVIAGKTIGGAARIARNEMPLRETGNVFKGITQNLQNEAVTVGGSVGKYATWRANRMLHAEDAVNTFAREADFSQFSKLRMFRGRTIGGQPAAYALHYAANSGDDALLDLTWSMLRGDPKAYARVEQLQKMTPDELLKYAPNSQRFLDAVSATKTHVQQLDDEAFALQRAAERGPQSGFYQWSIHQTFEEKQAQLAEATAHLKKYEDYGTWLELLGTKAGAKSLPLISATKGPTFTRHFYMDNHFGMAHTAIQAPRNLWIQKANTASMHDLNSGVTTISRLFDQWDHLYGYAAPDAREAALAAWGGAKTAKDRYRVLYDLEDNHVAKAISSHFPVDEDFARALVNKIHGEQNRVKRGVLSGNGSVYSSAPSLADRIRNPEDLGVELVSKSEDGKMYTLNLMDGRQHKVTIEIPEEAMAERVNPVDVTQTPNYYTPLDQRRLFLELKRHEDILAVANASMAERGTAELMQVIDAVGTRFNNFWKPLQLWRLGWPQRVLMDEMARAVALMGPMYLINGAGGEAIRNIAHNTPAYWRKRWHVRKNGKINIGGGPIEQATKASPNPFMREVELAQSVKLPEMHWPKYNLGRNEKLTQINANWSDWSRNDLKFSAWLKERSTLQGPELAAFDRKASRYGVDFLNPPVGAMPEHPIHKIANAPRTEGLAVYDPANGRRINNGLVIPIEDPSFVFKMPAVRDRTSLDNLAHWYEKHSELLSREGMRIVVDGDVVRIGRVYRPRYERLANDFLKMVDEQYPGTKMWDLERKISTEIERVDGLTDAQRIALEEAKTADEAKRAALANADLAAAEREELEFDFDTDSILERTRRGIFESRRFGTGTTTVNKGGKRITYTNAFGDHEGEIFKGLVSSDPTFDVVREGHGRTLDMFHQQAQGHIRISPPSMTGEALKRGTMANKKAVLYFQRWADMVNDQIGNSPIWNKMLQGKSDAQIVHWLTSTHEGAVVQREVMRYGEHPELWVNEHRAKLNYYLPDQKLQRLLAKGRLEPSDLRRNVHDADLPTIFGPDIEVLDKRKGFGKFLNDTADKLWHSLGTVPVDQLSRHPFAKAMYDMKMRSLINTTDAKWLTPETIERFQSQSREFAMTQIKRTLWDLTDQTNFTDAVRFASPFWGAQQEAITKWLRIISDRPETVARFFEGQRAVYSNFYVIDENGEPVNTARRSGGMYGVYHPTDRVVLSVPESLRKHLGPLKYISELGIPISSANTVLQGEMPLLPAPGPILTMPANQFLNWMDDKHGVTHDEDFLYRWLFPIGRPHSKSLGGQIWEQIAPGYGRRIQSAVDQDSVAYQNQYMQMAREMTLKAQREGKPLPTPTDIKKATDFLFGVRVFSSLVSPVQLEFRPAHQYFVDAYHKYQRDFGLEAWDRFVDDYGDEAAIYATSSSNSTVGVPPTSQGMEEWSKNKELIAKYPEWGDAMISPQAYTDDFSSDAYYAQSDINTGPGSSVKLREFTSPADRLRETNEKLGWREFRKFSAALNAELSARGLTDIRQAGAEDLAALKITFKDDLTHKYPDWRAQYDNYSNDIYARVAELEQFAGDPTFDSRPDIQGARQYLILRDMVARELDAYGAQGGSRNLQTEDNGALRTWFYQQVGQLILSNPAFGDFYARYLDADDLSQGGGGWLGARS